MRKVITYGTYDLLHYGHIKLLERAKALGDYLIVGVTSEDFDRRRGKININQSLIDRIENIKKTGLADKIIVEEYEGQKIDDILKYDVDVFTVGTDWEGKFDYLKPYCEVVYLERTEGISSSELRSDAAQIKMAFIGDNKVCEKHLVESTFVNGIEIASVLSTDSVVRFRDYNVNTFDEAISNADAVYIASKPETHYEYIKKALENNIHVLCEAPLTLSKEQTLELMRMAQEKKRVLMEAIKTAYATAFTRLCLMIKSGKIGNVVAVDATCTSLSQKNLNDNKAIQNEWSSMSAWGPTALLPVFSILDCDYRDMHIYSKKSKADSAFDLFTKIDMVYDDAVATVKIGKGVKSEGELIITGTKGYAVVPAPWWKTDYFEIRYENAANNKRYFYQLDGEGIRNELLMFKNKIQNGEYRNDTESGVSLAIAKVIDAFQHSENTVLI